MKINSLLLIWSIIMGNIQAEDVRSNMAEVLLTAELQASEGNKEKDIDGLIKKLSTIGYSTVSANKNLQVHYFNKYGEKNVEMLSFFSMINKKKIRSLLLSNPDFGAYAPFNFLVYKTLDTLQDNNTWYGHLATDTMLDIIGEKEEGKRKSFKEMVNTLDVLVNKQMAPTTSHKFEHTKPLPHQGLTKFVKKFKKIDDLETFIEDFVADHDGRFSKHEFIIAGFIDFKFEYEDMELDFDKYDAYWVSQLCHFKFSNSIFNRGIPEAGMFAPCSVYFYIPKGTNEIHAGYASVDNWVNALNFRDQRRIDYMRSIDAEVVQIFEEMGFVKENGTSQKTIPNITEKNNQNKNIEALKAELRKTKAALLALKKEAKEKNNVVLPVTLAVKKETTTEIQKIDKNSILPTKTFKTQKLKIGDAVPKVLSAYYAAQPQTVEAVKEKLTQNGFTVLSQIEVLKGHTVLSITNAQLQETNTYLAVLNMHIDITNEIRIQNPSYFGQAYLGEKFKYGQFNNTLNALQEVLGDMHMVKDIYETEELESFQFMMGMPRLDDIYEVAEGDNLVSKIATDKASKYIAYTLKLPNGDTLVGHKLRKRTNKFLTKISAERNSNLLPYQSIIMKNKAVILDPKYYLALSLPLLSMSDFMKIASAPDEIEKDIKRAYK